MNIRGAFEAFGNVLFERNVAGDCFYTGLKDGEGYGLSGSNLHIAQNHPILTPGLLFVSKIFSQADFYMENVNTGAKKRKHPILDMLRNPNYYQTQMDFLESLMFMQIANGVAVVYKKTIIGLPGETSAI